jgi:hypothetical protein
LYALATIFKIAPREYLPNILDKVVLIDTDSSNSLIRKTIVKFTTRVSLATLKPALASWRYKRSNKSTDGCNKSLVEEQEEIHVFPEIQDVAACLLSALQDRETIVRWSAAKGIGRLTSRLPRDFAQDIIDSVIGLFEADDAHLSISYVSDYAWHGACLSIAELAIRGLLLPDQLHSVMPWIVTVFLL